jgi:hypothetical protein
MKISLQIERLALHGLQLTPTDRAELAAALRAELGGLLASAGDDQPWVELGDRAQIEARPITYRPGSSPTRLGREIAASLYQGLQSHPPMDKV